MKIVSHSESHIVALDDGSRWQVFPGDLDITLGWKPETDLKLILIDDDVSQHALISDDDAGRVRVLPEGASWPKERIRTNLATTRRSKRTTER